MANRFGLSFVLGEDLLVPFTAKDAAGAAIEQADIAQVQFRIGSPAQVEITKTIGSGVTVAEGDGAYLIRVTPADCADLVARVYRAQVIIKTTGGVVSCQAEGTLNAREAMPRPSL